MGREMVAFTCIRNVRKRKFWALKHWSVFTVVKTSSTLSLSIIN